MKWIVKMILALLLCLVYAGELLASPAIKKAYLGG